MTSPQTTPVKMPLVSRIVAGNGILSVLAVLLALAVGAVLIVGTDPEVAAAAGYFFIRPTDTFVAIGAAVGGAYGALIQGGLINFSAPSFLEAYRPFLTSLGFATPLIAAGLGIAVGFRTGLFNVGGQGQLLIGGALGGYVGFALPMPPGLHLVAAVLAAVIGGALWAGIAGILKARTGAHEVIVTIMLNYIAFYLVSYLLKTPVLRDPSSSNPKSPAELPTATFPSLFGAQGGLDVGLLAVIAATVATWWLLSRSGLGFKFRAVGLNARAARVAGISVNRTYIVAMLVSGGLIGLAGAYQVLGQTTTGFGASFDAGIGFNAITVALLGRSRPGGVFAAGLLFGVFQAGGYTMQATEGISIDLITVIQALIVLFVAAPPLTRALFRLRGFPRQQTTTAPIVSGEGSAI